MPNSIINDLNSGYSKDSICRVYRIIIIVCKSNLIHLLVLYVRATFPTENLIYILIYIINTYEFKKALIFQFKATQSRIIGQKN